MINKNKGFSLIELLIIVAIISILAMIFGSIVSALGGAAESYQRGGTICKSGYLWNVDMEYHQRQVLNEHGGGVSCK